MGKEVRRVGENVVTIVVRGRDVSIERDEGMIEGEKVTCEAISVIVIMIVNKYHAHACSEW